MCLDMSVYDIANMYTCHEMEHQKHWIKCNKFLIFILNMCDKNEV